MKSIFLPIGTALALFFLDLVSKDVAQQVLQNNTKEIFPGLLAFSYHQNAGIALSLPVPLSFQIILTLVLLIGLLWYAKDKTKTREERIAIASIVGGALGNFWERILFGSVTDFIAVWKFPIFNVADIAISLGVLALLFLEFSRKRRLSV